MKYLLFVFTFLILNHGVAQDSSVQRNYVTNYINRSFDSIPDSEAIELLESKYDLNFSSLSSCINPLTSVLLNDNEVEIMKIRLEKIAEIFYNEGTPILISVGGINSFQSVEKYNKKRNKYNLKYVSFGNGCLIHPLEHEFEKTFNAKTMKLIGISKPKI